MTSPATAAPSLPDDVALPRELARLTVLPDDKESALRQLAKLSRLATKYKALYDATHDTIARLAVHGQDTLRPKATQDEIALALGVTGPRVNAIVKAARVRFGPAPVADRQPREPVDTTT